MQLRTLQTKRFYTTQHALETKSDVARRAAYYARWCPSPLGTQKTLCASLFLPVYDFFHVSLAGRGASFANHAVKGRIHLRPHPNQLCAFVVAHEAMMIPTWVWSLSVHSHWSLVFARGQPCWGSISMVVVIFIVRKFSRWTDGRTNEHFKILVSIRPSLTSGNVYIHHPFFRSIGLSLE